MKKFAVAVKIPAGASKAQTPDVKNISFLVYDISVL